MQDDNMQLHREVAELSAKMEIVLRTLSDLQADIKFNNMPRQEIEARLEKHGERMGRLEARVRDLEQAGRGMFFRWAPIITAVVGTGTAVFVALTK